ncbi:hypothetical protein HGRIS_007448 [Hohenbuehelia grisea]
MGRRRDSTDGPLLTTPRKLSTSGPGPLPSPRDANLPATRPRIGVSPSFDGVLNGGEGWVARRRASEARLNANGTRDENSDARAREIREEDEDGKGGMRDSSGGAAPQRDEPVNSETSSTGDSVGVSDTNAAGNKLGSLSQSGTEPGAPAPLAATQPHPAITDLASVEWSYLDPQGQVQGPFRADLMQKWYDDGYFAADLLMKRTNIDVEWLRVDDLARRAAGDKIFLSLPVEALPPPGLSRRTESPLSGLGISPSMSLNGPYQPSPIRTLRAATLDSYIGNTSSSASASPSSSFGAGRFGNGSPDPVAFGGRAAAYADPTVVARSPFGSTDPLLYNTVRRDQFDANAGLGPQAFGNLGRLRPVDNYGVYNGGYHPQQGQWPPTQNAYPGGGYEDPNGGRTSADLMPYASNFRAQNVIAATNPTNIVPIPGANFPDVSGTTTAAYDSNSRVGQTTTVQSTSAFNNVGTAPYSGAPQTSLPTFEHPPVAATAPTIEQKPTNSIVAVDALPSQNTVTPATPVAPAQSVWNADANGTRRPGPFDAAHPKATNIKVAQPGAGAQPSPWGRTEAAGQAAVQPEREQQSPWFAASQDAADEKWKEPPGPNSLTVSNLGQHNEQQQQLALAEAAAAAVTAAAAVVDVEPSEPSPKVAAAPAVKPSVVPESQVSPTTPAPVAPTPATTASRGRRKSTTQQAQKPAALTPVPPVPAKNPSPPPPVRAPWANDDETKKSKPSGLSLSLREIQEAEAQKTEARKAAERERERARANATPAAASEDIQPFTASWGLPTSQAGNRGNATPLKETAPVSASSPAASTPVWTSTPKLPVVKKTMKEIQEEEERRKKLAVKETTAAAAARRGYAETTNKTTPVATPPAGGSAWTVVGAGGKAPAVAVPARPALSQQPSHLSTSAASSAPRANGVPATRPTVAAAVAKSVPASARVEDYPVTPSHDFLKWLSDSLKGLNSSVNVEEIMSMLLSFPLDPDPSTAEIISDLIYEHSTVLDGRRFAAEFVSKRKADVASRPKGASANGVTGNKPFSIAEVVKAQPKPTQPEWGGFKVVNKKKKGGRA